MEIAEKLGKDPFYPSLLNNDFLLKKMSTGLAGGALLSNKTELGRKFWLRFQKNDMSDYFDTVETSNLLWRQSNQGKEMIQSIVKAFEPMLIHSNWRSAEFKGYYEAVLGTNILPNIKDIAVLLAVVGGTQELKVSILELKKIPNVRKWCEYEVKLVVYLLDDFGVEQLDFGNNFVNKFGDMFSFKLVKDKDAYRESLLAFWILQHQRGIKPFRTVLTFELNFKGKYAQ